MHRPAATGTGGMDQRQAAGYRADIDGLRALAVLPIVAYHLGYVRLFGGGYVGVDVFFVISGFLIGGSVLQQVRHGRYDIAAFYVRRFRRIVPALAVALGLTTLAVWWVLLPEPFADYARSLMATVPFASNVQFWLGSGYFDAASETKPLLHTWSLAVEEQFYIVLPLLAWVLSRYVPRFVVPAIALLALASFALNLALIGPAPAATFYLLPTRLWELLLGVLIAGTPLPWLDRRALREAAAALGLLLVVAAIVLLRPTTPFPGMAAALPCLGTALLIAAGSHGTTLVGRALSLRPAVFFGLISYSLYLWHWPVIVLLREGLPVAVLPHGWRLAALAVSTAGAWASWRWIERPWRDPAIPPRRIMAATGLAGAVLVAAGALVLAGGGYPARWKPETVRIAAMENDERSNNFRRGRCFISSADRFAQFDRAGCVGTGGVLIVGDSHAAHLWSGLQRRFPAIPFGQATASGCKPVPIEAERHGACAQMYGYLYGELLAKGPPRTVLLAASWDPPDLAALPSALDWLSAHGHRVVLAGPVPRYQVAVPKLLALATERGMPSLADRLRNPEPAAIDAALRQLAMRRGLPYFSAWSALCRAGTCAVADAGGLPLQFDYGHLTAEGSLRVAGAFPAEAVERR